MSQTIDNKQQISREILVISYAFNIYFLIISFRFINSYRNVRHEALKVIFTLWIIQMTEEPFFQIDKCSWPLGLLKGYNNGHWAYPHRHYWYIDDQGGWCWNNGHSLNTSANDRSNHWRNNWHALIYMRTGT